MEKLKLPAYPTMIYNSTTGNPEAQELGFTKLEMGSLMIAQAFVARVGIANSPGEMATVAYLSNELAKSIIEQANK